MIQWNILNSKLNEIADHPLTAFNNIKFKSSKIHKFQTNLYERRIYRTLSQLN